MTEHWQVNIAIFCLAAGFIAGCAGGPQESRTPDATGRGVDPQVLSDVIASAFLMPGETQRRAIRVLHNARSIANVACGGSALGTPNSTYSRYDQSRYADLSLIAEKGFTESEESLPESNKKVDAGACAAKALSSYHEWRVLAAPWTDIVRTAIQAPAVTATKPEVASCLTTKSLGDVVADEEDPTATFLSNTDGYLSGDKQGRPHEQEMQRLSDVYAECTGNYFEALEAELAPERERMVERHRELLERFAAELSAAGYVP